MPKCGTFQTAANDDFHSLGLRHEDVAHRIKMSYRHFERQFNEETGQSVPLNTVAEMKKAGAISSRTVDIYFKELRSKLRLKKKELRMVVIIRSLRNLLNPFYRKSR